MSGKLFGDIATDIEHITGTRTGQRYIVDGLAYNNLGLGIKCVSEAWVRAHHDSITHGIPIEQTNAWLLMREAMFAIENLLCTKEVDIDLPCFTESDGSNPYYTPLQYLYVLNKQCMPPGSWTSDLAAKLYMRGASHELPEFWSSAMKSHANLMLTQCASAEQQSCNG